MFAVALEEVGLERFRVGDPQDGGGEKLLAFERGASGLLAGEDPLQIIIGQFLGPDDSLLTVAIEDHQVFVRVGQLVLLLDQIGAAGEQQIVDVFHVQLRTSQLVFVDQAFHRGIERFVRVEEDNDLDLVGPSLEQLERHGRKPVAFVGHPLEPYEVPARQIIHHRHQRQQREARRHHVQSGGPLFNGGKTGAF